MLIEIQDSSQIQKLINGCLLSAINAHGPITESNFASASKRVYSELKALARRQRDDEAKMLLNMPNNEASQA